MAVVGVTVYIGLGSNLDDPGYQLQQALVALKRIRQTTLQKVSPFYRSAAIGPGQQPDYVNAVARLVTTLTAESILDELQRIENAQRRTRDEKWGPRTLDLDILLYGDRTLDTERLTIPHPHMLERNFVLLPLLDIADQQLIIPGNGSLAEALKTCPDNPIEKCN